MARWSTNKEKSKQQAYNIPGCVLVWFMGGFLWNFFGLTLKGASKKAN